MAKKRNEKTNIQEKRQRITIHAAFGFFVTIMNKNKDIELTEDFKRIFRKLTLLTDALKKYLVEDLKAVNKIITELEKERTAQGKSKKELEIDYILASVTMVANYYEFTKGQKRYFSPMSYEQILIIQDEAIEMITEQGQEYLINQTFDYTEQLIKRIFEIK